MTMWRGVKIITLGTALLSPIVTYAAGGLPERIVTCTGVNCTLCNLAETAQNVLNTAIYIMIVLSAVLFAWAGFKMLTSGGNTVEYNAGKSIFANVIIGLVIILSGWLVVDVAMRMLVNERPGLPWNRICEAIENIFEHHYA